MSEQEPIEVTGELKSLAESEITLTNGKSTVESSNLLKWTGLLLSICILGAFITVIYSLFVSLGNENEVKDELGCVRGSAVLVDAAVAQGIAHVIALDDLLLVALNEVAQNDDEDLAQVLEAVPALTREGRVVNTNLLNSIKARQAANERC